ncbi:nicolin-1-like isoform X2 [Gigantopelta aegis]|uniref:nicolin-1-like isoform X2 n=1 Tax=Gigantopelta aegis TaxID=1735272 RepID=UPI001B887CF4|nr:nicolin-1-like isoform X2 [Gigantopelta aegis]
MSEKPLHSAVKNPVTLIVGDQKSEFNSGCRVIDITFPNVLHPEDPASSEVGEIRFKNYYVALLTIRAKFRVIQANGEQGDLKWRTCVRNMKLMPKPHTEAGSQDYFCLTRKHFLFELVNVISLRLILQQPSPVWKEFKLEDIKIFRTMTTPKGTPLPAWLTEELTEKPDKKLESSALASSMLSKQFQSGGVPDLDSLSANLQELWAMTEEVAGNQTNVRLGRYEVDGCYEINLLSYT